MSIIYQYLVNERTSAPGWTCETGDTRITGLPDVTADDSGNWRVVLVAFVTVEALPLVTVVLLVAGDGPFATEAATEETGARICCPLGVCTI